jgi:hypothetical protein
MPFVLRLGLGLAAVVTVAVIWVLAALLVRSWRD